MKGVHLRALCPMGTVNVCTKFNGKPTKSYWDIFTTVVDWPIEITKRLKSNMIVFMMLQQLGTEFIVVHDTDKQIDTGALTSSLQC